MSWWAIAFLVFSSLVLLANVLEWALCLVEERKLPFLYEVGQKVIRIPAFGFQAHLIATSKDYRRYMVIQRKRNWIGRKVYKTTYPTVDGFVWFRERELRKNFD